MARANIEFDNPPVVEVILGAQFAPVAGLTAPHSGWFWREHLGKGWDGVTTAPPIPDQFERFGDEQSWQSPGFLQLQLTDGSDTRVRFTRDQGEQMIQLQPTRLHYNWQKRAGAYPHYANVRRSFCDYFEQFGRFLSEMGMGPLAVNQWELTYIDHIPQGELWKSPADWPLVVPGLFPPERAPTLCNLEGVGGEWHFEIPPGRGRLHVAARSGRIGDSAELVLALHITARGPAASAEELTRGLDLGHEVVVATFMELTSAKAHRAWGIRS